MSITDELREWMFDHTVNCSDDRIALVAIADRIDAEHESKVSYWQETSYKDGYDEGFASADDYFTDKRETLREHGWVKLPVDADGVPIHVGDVMEWCDPDGEVTVTCEVDAVGVECFFAWDGANGRYAQKCANAYRHHHPPTVEDVLDEFVARWMDTHHDDLPALKAEYAAKLRLAGEGE